MCIKEFQSMYIALLKPREGEGEGGGDRVVQQSGYLSDVVLAFMRFGKGYNINAMALDRNHTFNNMTGLPAPLLDTYNPCHGHHTHHNDGHSKQQYTAQNDQ
jgi:hypothetical protein